ncbi:flagellar export protein FliJ [Vreelandella sulfidaeris]|uniref:Flagellar FliJ protein n=1 Tax=Vreelandella sulfidaeris TaxID=115553 RepID=A0A365TKL2_9GAMM|nr:flagellar export protein FliJ [Halomonas sulfidaeris]RBI65489.1 flagellar export protein FliJ [Halomonas sulfidaeris]|tara:strand:+ start:90 stop:542 length:453 start_codon:yes stop_codon:yes gene_type:complete
MSTSQLAMLTGLAKDARDQAGKVLAQERQTEQQTTAQLQSLLSYRAEYAERLQKAMRDGIDPATMYNYQQFLASLDAALSRARQALAAQQASVQQSQKNWQQEQRKLSSYDTLASRRLLEEHRRSERHEQKTNDDLVTSRLARQHNDTPH